MSIRTSLPSKNAASYPKMVWHAGFAKVIMPWPSMKMTASWHVCTSWCRRRASYGSELSGGVEGSDDSTGVDDTFERYRLAAGEQRGPAPLNTSENAHFLQALTMGRKIFWLSAIPLSWPRATAEECAWAQRLLKGISRDSHHEQRPRTRRRR